MNLRPLRADEITYINEHYDRCFKCNHIDALHYVDREWGEKWCHICDDVCVD